jgi:hypothetical protein
VFGNLRYNKRLTRFTLRGREKVDGQWQRVCLVHNIQKLAHHGYAASHDTAGRHVILPRPQPYSSMPAQKTRSNRATHANAPISRA